MSSKSDAVVEKVSLVAVILVVLAVAAGIVRLILADWSYVFLLALLMASVYYVYRNLEK
jgi:hypothetical protein